MYVYRILTASTTPRSSDNNTVCFHLIVFRISITMTNGETIPFTNTHESDLVFWSRILKISLVSNSFRTPPLSSCLFVRPIEYEHDNNVCHREPTLYFFLFSGKFSFCLQVKEVLILAVPFYIVFFWQCLPHAIRYTHECTSNFKHCKYIRVRLTFVCIHLCALVCVCFTTARARAHRLAQICHHRCRLIVYFYNDFNYQSARNMSLNPVKRTSFPKVPPA